MARLFYWLTGVSVVLILVAGIGVFWMDNASLANAKQEMAAAAAKTVAFNVSARIGLLNDVLDKMAQNPDVHTAISTTDPRARAAVAAELEKHLPAILKVRLLTPEITQDDDNSAPRMGFADLDMVRETFAKHQPPAIQGDKGADRHLAIARQIVRDRQVVGVILASFDTGAIQRNLRVSSVAQEAYIELKQDKLTLGSVGNKLADGQMASNPIKVTHTNWDIYYQYDDSVAGGNGRIIFTLITVPALLSVLVFFIGYRSLSDTLANDLQSLTKAFKDMMTHSSFSSYPVQLPEINVVISTLMQFKRVIEDSERHEQLDDRSAMNIVVSDQEDFNLDDFLGDSTDFKL